MNHHPRLAIRNVALIDGVGTAALPGHSVVLDGGTIEWVGRDDAMPALGDQARVIDGTGFHLLPGFIDAHVHMSMPAGRMNGLELLDTPPGFGHFAAIPLLRDTLEAGVTTVRDLGGIDMATDMAIKQGLIVGPDMVFAHRVLGPTGGHGDFRTCCGFNKGAAIAPSGDIGFLTDGIDSALRNTREVMRQGAGVIKVMASGGVWSPRDMPWNDGLNVAEMRAIVDEAASHGIPVAAHAQSARSIVNALTAGVTSIEHAYEIDDDGIALMLDTGAYMVPTLTTGTIPPDPATSPSYAVDKKLRLQEKLYDCVAAAIDAGVKVAMGTDAGVCPHGVNLRELALLADFGMKPMDALKAGTRDAAELLRLQDRVGTVEAGKDADLLLTRIDPVSHIEALAEPSNISMVIAKGRIAKDAR